MVLELSAGEYVMTMSPVRVAYDAFVERDRLAILEVARLAASQKTEERSRAGRARRVLDALDVENRIEAVTQGEASSRAASE